MNTETVSRYFHTLRHLKPIQLWHQIYYRVRPVFGRKKYSDTPSRIQFLTFSSGIPSPPSFQEQQTFCFLNHEKAYDTINWNYRNYGKLWTYNLNYFDFLHQLGMEKETALRLMRDYLVKAPDRRDGIEPYPTSVRSINWIKFLSIYNITDEDLNALLYRDCCRLIDHLEYHLLGNHLLENGFALLYGALYFRDQKFEHAASQILNKELNEQILEDGAHYELSPMYHQIILYRVLDAYNLLNSNPNHFPEVHSLLEKTALKMLGWLQTMSWEDGSIPFVNDAAPGIAPGTRPLVAYASKLGLKAGDATLLESGYRKFHKGDFEVLFDACNVMPVYQPGHIHADTLQVLLRYLGRDILVDTGTSTYDKNKRRQEERSTAAHNTVTIDDKNSSQVWGGFRVGRRAEVSILEEGNEYIEAKQNGYSIPHIRSLNVSQEKVVLLDKIEGKATGKNIAGHLHFPPGITPKMSQNSIDAGGLAFNFDSIESLKISAYLYAGGFNKLIKAWKVTYEFKESCRVKIRPI